MKLPLCMEEVSPWSRLGFSKFQSQPNEEVLRLRDQVMELSKVIGDLTLRIEKLERENEGPAESVFSVVDHKDIYGEDFEHEDVEFDKSDITVVKSGFTAPPPKEIEEVEESDPEAEEPIGNDVAEENIVQKEFDDDASIIDRAALLVEMVKEYIEENGAVLNNQLSRKVYPDIDFEVNKKVKDAMKEIIAGGEEVCGFKAHKKDNFRILYYIGDDADEEYEKAFG